MTKVLARLLSLVFFVAAMRMWITTFPMINIRSLDELPATSRQAIPAWARGFSNDHGKLVFRRDGPIREERVKFVVRLAAGSVFLVAFGVFSVLGRTRRLDPQDRAAPDQTP